MPGKVPPSGVRGLWVNHLSKSYEGRAVLQDLSFQLRQKEIFGLIGESGSGKTTLLRLLAGLLEPDSGEILLDSQPVPLPSSQLIAGHPQIRLVPQTSELFPRISVAENLLYPLRFYEKNYRNLRLENLLILLSLQDLRERLPSEISGGERQRVAFGVALATEPQVLLLDEPFNQLDFFNKQKLREEICRIVKSLKISCLLVTHEVQDAFSLADRIGIFREGTLWQTGTPESIYQKPLNAYVAHLTGWANVLEKTGQILRPEQLEITDAEVFDFEGKIKQILFLGSHYLLQIQVSKQIKLWVNSVEKISVKQKVKVKIKE
jgi:ABC-type Fe3+/spermidine/putrescine transport system ATPase subunit